MGKINGCLKCLFVFFNVVFAVLGSILVYGTVKASFYSSQMEAAGGPGIGWGWVFALGILGISCLGIYAAISEKLLALKIFAGFMGVGMVIMMIFGIIVSVTRNKIKYEFDSASSETLKPYMKNEEIKALLDSWQQVYHCCGVKNAEDWGDTIPESCQCTSGRYGGSRCKPKPQGASGPAQVYSKSCSDALFVLVDVFCKIAMGFFFGFAITALLGLLVSIFMIYQVKRHNSDGGFSIAMKGY
ncbi:23 kDa integral membrane protein-like [Parambassis ranga]|uniref:Tetraspanin n=1 Tax=Parambassis ranga TaxID=210632 RepID=A0A6P7HUG7_9TELE|nr:23 kDa integral membrane protein-like [Parambassis ranga]